MSKRFALILAALAVFFVGFIWVSKHNKQATPSGNVSGTSSHVQGKATKGVALIEYGDFQCSHCGTYFPVVEQIRQQYGNEISFQFRNFPIVQIHPNAMVAHRAAEAADKQGKFWEMYKILYEQQQGWSESSNASRIMEDYATQVGLNLDKFRQDFASEAVNNIINADVQAGQALGITGTPTFVLNGKKLDPGPAPNVAAFTTLIDQAIAAAKK